MAIDIYTKQSIATPSDEHVLPRSLGGRLWSRDLIDKSTNDGFGGGIDAELEKALRGIRLVVNARNADGDPPRSLARVNGEDGNKYVVEPGGRAKVIPKGKIVKLPEGGSRFNATVSDADDVRQMLRKKFKGREAELEAAISKAMAEGTHSSMPSPAMAFDLPLWFPQPYRATAKIAFNLLAVSERELALSPAFDSLRGYVLVGKELPVLPVQAAAPPSGSTTLGPLDHLVLLEIQPGGEVVASVTYFAHLSFVIRLGRVEGVASRRVAYRVDQLTGRDRRNYPNDLALNVPSFEEATALTYEEFLALAHAQRDRLIPLAEEIQGNNVIRDIANVHLERLVKEKEDRFTREDVTNFIEGVVVDVVRELGPNIEAKGGSVEEFANALRKGLLLAVSMERSDLLPAP